MIKTKTTGQHADKLRDSKQHTYIAYFTNRIEHKTIAFERPKLWTTVQDNAMSVNGFLGS